MRQARNKKTIFQLNRSSNLNWASLINPDIFPISSLDMGMEVGVID